MRFSQTWESVFISDRTVKTYKGIEKQAKVFGLTILDWIILFCVVAAYMFISFVLDLFGLGTGLAGMTVLIIVEIYLFYMLRSANKKKSPNYLLGVISYKLLQVKK